MSDSSDSETENNLNGQIQNSGDDTATTKNDQLEKCEKGV